jgi:hypothetical protein
MLLVGMPAWGNKQPFYALAHVAGIAQDAGWTVRIADLNIEVFRAVSAAEQVYWENDYAGLWCNPAFVAQLYDKHRGTIESLLRGLVHGKSFELIGFSVNSFTRHATLHAAPFVASLCPRVPILFGGPDCFPLEHGIRYLRDPGYKPDLILQGEAEVALPLLLHRYAATGVLPTDVPGFAHRQHGTIIDNGEPELPSLRQCRVLADYSQFPLEAYAFPGRFYTFLSRGCINRCAFCNERLNFRRFRCRRAEDVFAEIQRALPLFQRFREEPFVDFADSMVNADLKELERLCDLIVESGVRIQWGVQSHLRAEMSRELLEKMKTAGCVGFFWGFESAAQRVVDRMGKRFQLVNARRIIAETSVLGMENHLALIVGFPGETPADVVESAMFVLEHRDNPHMVFMSIAACIIKRNTQLYTQPAAFGIAEASPALNADIDSLGTYWCTADQRNTIETRSIRHFVMANAANNRSLSLADCVDHDQLWAVNNNNLYCAAEIAGIAYELCRRAGWERHARRFLETWNGEKVSCLPSFEPWRPESIPGDVRLDRWFGRDKNNRGAKTQIMQFLLESLAQARAAIHNPAPTRVARRSRLGDSLRWSFAHVHALTGFGRQPATVAPVERPELVPLSAPQVTAEERMFRVAGARLLHWQPGDGVAPWHGCDVAIHEEREGLAIMASDNDPALLLPPFKVMKGQGLALRIELTAPAHTILQVFFLLTDAPHYAEERSECVFLKPGRNTVFVLLDHPRLAGRVRLDPGDVPGKYVLHEVEVRQLPRRGILLEGQQRIAG